MRYKELKEKLDQYFSDDDEIYPHAGAVALSFTTSTTDSPAALPRKRPAGH